MEGKVIQIRLQICSSYSFMKTKQYFPRGQNSFSEVKFCSRGLLTASDSCVFTELFHFLFHRKIKARFVLSMNTFKDKPGKLKKLHSEHPCSS